jgi:hypothetical protein
MKSKIDFNSNLDVIKWLEKKIYVKNSRGKNILDLLEYKGNSLFFTVFLDLVVQLNNKILLFEENQSFLGKLGITKKLRDWNSGVVGLVAKVLYRIELRKKTKKKKILFFTYAGAWRPLVDENGNKTKKGDFNQGQLMDEISKLNKDFELVTVAPIGKINDKKSVFETLSRVLFQKHRHIPLEAFWSSEVKKKTYAFGDILSRRWEEFISSEKNHFGKESFGSDKIGKKIKLYLDAFVKNYYFGVVRNFELVERLICKEKPDLIVVTNNGSHFWKVIIQVAKLNGIKVISLQHAIMLEKDIAYYCFEPNGKIVDLIPDKIAVYGKDDKEFIIKNFNYPKEKIVITGPYAYDFLFKLEKTFDRKKYLSTLSLDLLKKTVFFAAQFRFSPFIELDEIVMKELKKVDKAVNIIIKPHPRGDFSQYAKWIKNNNLNAVLLDSLDMPYNAILASDLVISFPSTIVFEAVILQRECLMLNVEIGGEKAFWDKNKNVFVTDKPKEIYRSVNNLVNSKGKAIGKKEDITNLVYKTDGNAFQRILKLMEKEI